MATISKKSRINKTSSKKKYNSATRKKDIISKLESVDESTKRIISSNQIDSSDETKKVRHTKYNSSDEEIYIKLPILDIDTSRVEWIKEEINARKITKKFVEERLCDLYGMDEATAASKSYNMIYTVKPPVNRKMSDERIEIWTEVLGLKNIRTVYDEPESSLMSSYNYPEPKNGRYDDEV